MNFLRQLNIKMGREFSNSGRLNGINAYTTLLAKSTNVRLRTLRAVGGSLLPSPVIALGGTLYSFSRPCYYCWDSLVAFGESL
jgi:hypothetical protein